MRYVSVCSGIEAATVAWHDLGWEPVAFAEIDSFPSAVLARHFPAVPNLGDISKVDWRPYHGAVDLVVGGTPCQSFSIAGRREGLDGASGLVFEYFRLLREVQPRWFVWENVPGSFSSNGGADFQSILREWDKLGYHVAWRVLDAQHFGVPQRRRRIFAVGYLGDWRYPAKVLFEPESLRGNTPKSGKARKGSAASAESRTRSHWEGGPHPTLSQSLKSSGGIAMSNQELFSQGGGGLVSQPWPAEKARCLSTSNQRLDYETETFVVGTLAASGAGTSRPAGQGNELDVLVPVAMAIQDCVTPKFSKEKAFTLTTLSPSGGGHPQAVAVPTPLACDTYNHTVDSVAPALTCKNDGTHSGPSLIELMPHLAVRRLTPTECERLQGFPDGWTNIPWRGKDHAPDGPRYKALGNSMAVPCMRWIGERIQEVEDENGQRKD
jgi:DNA (cytosine-5)-methyltransferase 1